MPDRKISPNSLANLRPWKAGECSNPGGGPKGKRISTWMAEFGEMSPSQWIREDSEEYNNLPVNAQIALARLKDALGRDKLALSNSEYVEPHRINVEAPGVQISKDTFLELCETYWRTKPGSVQP